MELGDTSKSLLTLREYIESIDSKNGTSRVIMFGHSLGGTIAQLYAMNDYPVSGMVLLASCGVEESDVRCMRESLFPSAKHQFFLYCLDLLLSTIARNLWLKRKILPKLFSTTTTTTTAAPSTTRTSPLQNPTKDSINLLEFTSVVKCLSDAEAPFLQIEKAIADRSVTKPSPSPKSTSNPSLFPLPMLNLLPENDLLIPKSR
ncbi:hypothetical protein TL16_g05393 [Triparma laevis f. inornata]|uniref:Serine aminopeptidase S33 domain-containing protein n=1 Tax=Triparma laevis f. inornata TaxID=1714386 RepID=A0A9W7EBR5_9STRA|nr:hypothetical protein TL16_g05393 [Triparma laevis f. inornata]